MSTWTRANGTIMTPSILIFDFFGVICSEIAPFWLSERFPPVEATRIKRELVGLADTGAISEDVLFDRLADLTGSTSTLVYDQWRKYIAINKDVLNILEAASSEYRIALLSNAPSRFVRRILSDHSLEKYFETIVVSSEEQVAKPDPVIYRRILERLSAKAEDAVMIDDNASNIAGAEQVGMRALLFSTAEKLERDLKGVQKSLVSRARE